MTVENVNKDLCKQTHKMGEQLCLEKHTNIERRFEGIEATVAEALNKMSAVAEDTNRILLSLLSRETQGESVQQRLWQAPWFGKAVLMVFGIIFVLLLTSFTNQLVSALPVIDKVQTLIPGGK